MSKLGAFNDCILEDATQSRPCHNQPARSIRGLEPEGQEGDIFWTNQLDLLPCGAPTVAALEKLPRLRELTLRTGRDCLNLYTKKNHEAALGQTRGETTTVSCERCLKNNGPFTECVLVPGRFAGACCNCHYSSQGVRCSFRRSGKLNPFTTRCP